MVLLVLLAIADLAVPFGAVVVLANFLLMICEPKGRLAAITCFVAPAVAILAGLIAWPNATTVLRYSAQGSIIWFLLWPALALACIGIISAGFAVMPYDKAE